MPEVKYKPFTGQAAMELPKRQKGKCQVAGQAVNLQKAFWGWRPLYPS